MQRSGSVLRRLSPAANRLPRRQQQQQQQRVALATSSSQPASLATRLQLLESLKLGSNLNYVRGARTAGAGATFDCCYPATDAKIATVAESTVEDVEEAAVAAEEALSEWQQVTPMDRSLRLTEAARLLRSRAETIAQVEVLDTGKPVWEARADVEACCDTLHMFAGLVHTLAGEHVHLPGGSFYYTRREPFGVCAGIGAWNYPFQMAVWKSAPALACGNALLFKPSPLTPLSAVLLAEAYTEAGVPPGVFNVLQGGAVAGGALCNSRRVAKMSFTGSVPTGVAVAEASAKLVRPTTLELGGKSPLIIFDDADLDEAVKGAVLANFLCQGQVCSNGTRVFVQAGVADEFLQKLLKATAGLRVGDPFDEDTAVGATISAEQFEKVQEYLAVGEGEGARRAFGGDRVSVPGHENGRFLRPCVLTNCNDSMRVVQEEIFGSVLSLLTFDTEAEAVRRANATRLGLAGGVFTRDLSRAHRVIGSLQAGSLYVNTYNVYPPGVPFGGYKMSGYGRENCAESLRNYSQVKSVYVECAGIDLPTVP